jgi:hypothetical protein
MHTSHTPNIKRFLPKGPFVRSTTGVKITKAVRPRKTQNPERAKRFFARHGITDFQSKPMRPLSEKEDKELREVLQIRADNPIKFYRDNRNLFSVSDSYSAGITSLVEFRRMNVRGNSEKTPYAQIFYQKGENKTITIVRAGIDKRFRTGNTGMLTAPKPVFSGRGLLKAFVEIMEKKGVEQIFVELGLGSEKAYKSAGFKFHSTQKDTSSPIWVWRKKGA